MEKGSTVTPLLGDRYQLQQTLGTGGMAVVYKAWDLRLERPVAIKLLRQDFSKDEAFRERFRQEAKAAANLSHPNIVTVHDFGLDAGRLYIVMEFIPGTDLKTLLKRRGRFTVDEAIPLIVQACAGIGYAHRAGIIHCDIKSQNLLVTPDNRLKVTDFGIARALASISPDEKHDVVWGSPQYFAPEQAAGGPPTLASDVYSLGVIMYEMLTGKLPFSAKDPTELARLHRDANPIPPRQLNPEISPALEQILLKVLSKEPAARYRTADQLGRILMSFSTQASPFENNFAPLPSAAATTVTPSLSNAAVTTVSNPSNIPTQVFSPDTQPSPVSNGQDNPVSDIDWGAIGLGLVALLAVGGLIPFWIYIIGSINLALP